MLKIGNIDKNKLTGKVIGSAIEVHRTLGPGLLESIYEECLCIEFDRKNISYERQKEIPIEYRGVKLDCRYRIDITVEDRLIVELKACETLLLDEQIMQGIYQLFEEHQRQIRLDLS